MKTFKVKETILIEGWTYVTAESEKEAITKIENGETDKFQEVDEKHDKTEWKTLQEVT